MRSSLLLLPRPLRLRSFSHHSRRRFNPQTGRRIHGCAKYLFENAAPARRQFGQPLHETHPHLLKSGELTPGITAIEYAQRRANLAASLPDKAVAIVPSGDITYRPGSSSVFYEFHQDPNFFYLTGFNEPEALAVIEKTGSGASHKFHLYVRPKDHQAELWEGSRSGDDAALDVFNADEAGTIKHMKLFLPGIIENASEVYTDLRRIVPQPSHFSKFFQGASDTPEGFYKLLKNSKVKDLHPLMNELRVIKSDGEIANMKKAGQFSGRAYTHAMQKSFKTEKDLASFLEFSFKNNGCDGSAYIPVVAGGKNALGIHYVRNDDLLREGEVTLVDAGGEYGGYVTDITRTWPTTGRFSPAQKDLYEVVLKAQKTCISLSRESSKLSLNQLHDIASSSIKDDLQQLGFDMSHGAIDVLFPHHLGHYIGLEVHDSPTYPRRYPLRAGQCITIEPGIYVPEDTRWPAHYWGIGIRIEDSLCVQKESPLVFSTEAVKEVVDIEALR